jgi:hypothetical protein
MAAATPDAPYQGREPQHQLALDRRLGVGIRSEGRFECSVVYTIFQGRNDGFSGQSATDLHCRDWR